MPRNISENGQKLPYLCRHSQKNEAKNHTIFFIAVLKTCQVF